MVDTIINTSMNTGTERELRIVPETSPQERGLSQVDNEFKAETFTFREIKPSSFKGRFSKPLTYATMAVMAASISLLPACGEAKAQAGNSPTVPEATASAFAEQNPNATYKVYLPIVTNGPPGQETNTTIAANPASAAEISSKTSEPAQQIKFEPKIEITAEEIDTEFQTLIDKVNHPDPKIIAQYNYTPDRILSNQQPLLNGYLNRQIPGLLTIKENFDKTGDKAAAKMDLEKVFKIFLLYKTLLPGGPDKVTLSDEEKKSTDPEYIYFDRDAFAMFSAVNKEVGIETVKALYLLGDKPLK